MTESKQLCVKAQSSLYAAMRSSYIYVGKSLVIARSDATKQSSLIYPWIAALTFVRSQ